MQHDTRDGSLKWSIAASGMPHFWHIALRYPLDRNEMTTAMKLEFKPSYRFILTPRAIYRFHGLQEYDGRQYVFALPIPTHHWHILCLMTCSRNHSPHGGRRSPRLPSFLTMRLFSIFALRCCWRAVLMLELLHNYSDNISIYATTMPRTYDAINMSHNTSDGYIIIIW